MMPMLSLLSGDLFLAASGLLLLLVAAFAGPRSGRLLSALCAATLVAAGALTVMGGDGTAFGGAWVADGWARFAKAMIFGGGALALFLAPLFFEENKAMKPEYPVLALFATLGMGVMVSARDLIVLYAGLELQSLALYVMAAFQREDRRASEAGMKYFILGSVSSAILLYGLSLLYGFAGSTLFADIAARLAEGTEPGVAVGLIFVLAGFAFKISAVPFHMWTPDVYEGAPTPVTGFLTSGPKIAAMALLARFLVAVLPAWTVCGPVLILLAAASMVLGSFAGLGQSNVKRLMGYSAIAHVGIMLVGFVTLDGAAAAAGLGGVLIYLALYFISALGVFACLLCLRRQGRAVEQIEDLAGLFKTHPALTLALGANLFSLAGIPPLAGFFGKYFVFLAAIKGGFVALTVLGVLASVVAAAYYLRIVKVMAFDEAAGQPLDSVADRSLIGVAALTSLSVALFILAPSPLMESAQRAAESLLAP